MSLTKEDLKKSLADRGIELPSPSAKKEEYQALYDKYVGGGDRFSSDEEIDKPADGERLGRKKGGSSSPSKKSEILTEENSMIVDGLNISHLRDEELFEKLKEHGVDVGPIVDSTRNIYRKKLAILLRGESSFNHSLSSVHENGNSVAVTNGQTNGKDEFSADEEALELEVEEEEVAIIKEEPIRRVSRRSISTTSRTSRSVNSGKLNSSTPIEIQGRFSDGVKEESRVTDRFTPTPRRSIHSYRVADAVMDENESHSLRSRYKTSYGNESLNQYKPRRASTTRVKDKKSVATSSKTLRFLPSLLLFLVVFAVAYYIYRNYNEGEEFSKYVDGALQWTSKTAGYLSEQLFASLPPTKDKVEANN